MHSNPTLLESFKENPIFYLLALLCAGAGMTLMLVALVTMKRAKLSSAFGFAAAAMGIFAMASGVAGYASSKRYIAVVLSAEGLTAKDIAGLHALLDGHARLNLTFGVVAGLLPLIGGVALGISGLKRAKRSHFASAGSSM